MYEHATGGLLPLDRNQKYALVGQDLASVIELENATICLKDSAVVEAFHQAD